MRLQGKVAFVTGAGRGQGRSHAIHLAQEGASVVAIDACVDVASAPYPMATQDDLDETARLVAQHGRVLARRVDVRDLAELEDVAAEAEHTFGGIDVVVANAGITSQAKTWEMTEVEWSDVIDINLTGVWRTLKATVPAMIRGGRGGSIIITSSTGGSKGISNHAHYCASKHGVVGVARTLAIELAEHMIRVNTIHPCAVDTPMIHNQHEYDLFLPGHPSPGRDDVAPIFQSLNLMPVPWIDPADVSNAVVWLASDEARFVTAAEIPVDTGAVQKYA
jgi:SDR family mycofactocin-dependent oxidoreductase